MASKSNSLMSRPAKGQILPNVSAIVAGPYNVRFEFDAPAAQFLPRSSFAVPTTAAVRELVSAAEKHGTPVVYQSAGQEEPLLFRGILPARFPPYELARLSDRMTGEDVVFWESGLRTDNENIPSGFSYFTQFVNHDLLYKARRVGRASDTRATREPRLNLDSLYGESPSARAGLYGSVEDGSAKFVLGNTADGRARDLPRNSRGIAAIHEPLNDNNFILAQLTALFMRFHNRLVDRFNLAFADARRQVTFHYQSALLNDLLPRLLNQATLDDVVARGAPIFEQHNRRFVPYEFSNAAFRLHTMTRQRYHVTRKRYLSIDEILRFTGEGGADIFPLDPTLVIDWSLFFPATEQRADPLVNFSRPIDPYISPTLQNLVLPHIDKEAQRLLKMPFGRPPTLGLVDVYASNGLVPSAQAALSWLDTHGYVTPRLTQSQTESGILAKLRLAGFADETPLFYYVLKEAEVIERGRRLGPLGSRIVAETIIGLLRSDHDSILYNRDWKPLVSVMQKGKVAMSDIVSFVGS